MEIGDRVCINMPGSFLHQEAGHIVKKCWDGYIVSFNIVDSFFCREKEITKKFFIGDRVQYVLPNTIYYGKMGKIIGTNGVYYRVLFDKYTYATLTSPDNLKFVPKNDKSLQHEQQLKASGNFYELRRNGRGAGYFTLP